MYTQRKVFLRENEILLVFSPDDVAQEACSLRFVDDGKKPMALSIVTRPGTEGVLLCEESFSFVSFGASPDD